MTTSGPETTGNKVMTDTTKSEDPKNGVPERLFRLPVATATVIAVILLASLTANALLALNLTAISRRQNTAWKNTNSAFARVINWASLDGQDVVASGGRQMDITELQTSLRLVRAQLENINLMPYPRTS